MKGRRRIIRRALLAMALFVGCILFSVFEPKQPSMVPEEKQEMPDIPEVPTITPVPTIMPVAVPQEEAQPQPEALPGMTENILWASPHFKMAEYACDCEAYCDGWPGEMAPELLEKIERLRCLLDNPVIITSGIRCKLRNTEVGGVPGSLHKRGQAADLYSPGIGVNTLLQNAQTLGLNVLPYYGSGYIHVEIL